MMRIALVFLLISFQHFIIKAQPITVIDSPDGKNRLELKIQDGLPFYRLLRANTEMLGWSALGLHLKNQPGYKSLELVNSEKSNHADVWKPIWEKSSLIKNAYHELKATFRETTAPNRTLRITFRVFDDGAAWRYELPEQPGPAGIIIEKDLTSFNLPGSGTWWAFNGERKHLGPAVVSAMPDTMATPFLFKNARGQFIAILEAGIKDMAYFVLQKTQGKPHELSCLMSASAVSLPANTSWRVVIMADKEQQLVESNLLVNLNPPSAIQNTSWIKPGKSTWNWRGWGYKTASGYEYKIDTESQKRFIDFASRNNIQYHLIDANWYGPEFDESSDPSVPKPDFNMQEILAYAKQHKVGVFLYLNDVGANKFGLERVLKQFHDWGAVGIKYGFMKGHGQAKVLHTADVISLCAKYQLMLFFHDDPVPPSGDHRTWPHILAREYGHAQADGKFSVYPESSVNQPFINMLAGPLDMNFGWFDLNDAKKRTKIGEAVPGTVAGELARTAAIFSGIICLPDVPEEYLAKPEMFDFIRRLPATFDEYKMIGGKIDDYISVARRAGNNWIVASLTNNMERKIGIKLDFLEKNKQYMAYLYEDAEGSHYLNNKEDYKTGKRKVKAGDTIRAYMAPGGGHCIYLEMIN